MTVQLGFLEQVNPGSLKPDIADFPSKVGGQPLWLNPHHILPAERASCGTCRNPMVLLLQIYTPEKEPAEAYHRCIYMFCCKNGACHRRDWRNSFKVFRCQLPQVNDYYDEKHQVVGDRAKQCKVCGLAGPKQCSKCHEASYCGKEHQVFHWTQGLHKSQCGQQQQNTKVLEDDERVLRNYLLSEYEMVIEDEPDVAIKKLRDGMNRVEVNNSSDQQGSLAMVPFGQEEYDESEVGVDRAFLKFQKRITFEPEQVLRYCRVTPSALDPIPPLWPSELDLPTSQHIKQCPKCQSPRAFEFQVMPQLLNHFDINHLDVNALDWGTLAVYTCSKNCVIGDEYAEEFVWRQMYSDHGVADQFKQNRNDKYSREQ
ncbi:hypothetical protein SmJEL517_g03341 [Synchytrium microbalum]|uniref:MYND-type domain-containing protein n=1 Tax=Synchytrium microbalum TaxID=1806994 RepID=A0A507C744_9FUNG|nr:uncharacterized protein SmJEL517_g03341 [Synchytrium microbalum]TPX33816.1 hypothetical protein SmJEL517_g03341 [Synchytrium microbalum]